MSCHKKLESAFSKTLENKIFVFSIVLQLDIFPYFVTENVIIYHLWKVSFYVRRKISYVKNDRT